MTETISIPLAIFDDDRLTRADRLVYTAIAHLIVTGRRSWYEDIADLADVSRSQVGISIAKLDDLGLIERRSRPGRGNSYSIDPLAV